MHEELFASFVIKLLILTNLTAKMDFKYFKTVDYYYYDSELQQQQRSSS
jgi:hypothetical protein